MSENLSYLSGRKGLHDNLLSKLDHLAKTDDAADPAKVQEIVDEYLISNASVHGALSFYELLRQENKNKKVYVCNGSSCLCAGTQTKVKSELKKHFPDEEIGEMTCLGRCHENAAFNCNEQNYSGEDIDNIDNIIESGDISREKYATHISGKSILIEGKLREDDLHQHLEHLLTLRSDVVLNEIKAAKLGGRGGAGFPMGIKLEAIRNAEGTHKFIVCNADEGDPGAYSDRYLLEEQTLKVILGMMIAGYASGADTGVVYVRAEYPQSYTIIKDNIEELRTQGLIGENILGSDFSFDLIPIKAHGAYVCGEETALLSSIEGQRPEVRVRPPFPAEKGLFNMPTLVNSVETLANLPFIIEHGSDNFNLIGSSHSNGTKLISLDSSFNRPGICEVEMGTPLRTVIDELGGGFRTDVKVLHIGGPLGGLVPLSKTGDLMVSFESFAENGFLLGHGSVIGIPENIPMIDYIEHLFRFAVHESCGKCFPCRLGSTRGLELIQRAVKDGELIDRELFNDLLETMQYGSLCMLGGGLPLPVKSALTYFENELEAYFR